MEDIFSIEESEPIEMGQTEFNEKTKSLCEGLEREYSKAWKNRCLKDGEYPDEEICDKCTGEGSFGEDNLSCFKDNGECYHRFCDYEQVGIELEARLCDLYELLSVAITPTPQRLETFKTNKNERQF